MRIAAAAAGPGPDGIVQLEPGPVPLYYQLEQQLRARIEGHEFAPGDCLPSEDQICDLYGVSRITVRRALEALQQQGLIERRRGVGSFVADKGSGMNSRLSGSLNEFLSSAAALRTSCLSLKAEEPTAEVASLLQLRPGEKAIRLKSVGSLDGEPVAFLDIWFPPDIADTLRAEEIDGVLPVVRLVEGKKQLRLTRAEQVIEPDRAAEEAAGHLGIDADTPILKVRRVYFAHPDRPIEVAYVRYHPERYRYAVDYRS